MPLAAPRPSRRRARRVLPIAAPALAALVSLSTASPVPAATPVGTPIGALDVVTATPSGVHVSGWTLDPNTPSPIRVSVSVDGRAIGSVTASSNRPDVARVYPRFGAAHGYAASYVVASGRHTVCVAAVNFGPGLATRLLGCKSVVTAVNPIGHLDAAQQKFAGVVVAGWAYDPDSAAPVAVSITDAGRVIAATTTRVTRADVALVHPGAGTMRGFIVTAPIRTAGMHPVCAIARNIGAGTKPTTSLGCITFNMRLDPLGNLHSIPRPAASSTITVDGWAVDPETDAPLTVLLSLDGAAPISVLANVAAPGLRVAYLGIGIRHAFISTFTVSPSAHRVCATALNLGRGANVSLGCQTSPTLVVPIAPVTSPALISTSRYIRNINGGSGDAVKTRAMGAADAAHNPSNHRYLTLLQIGGQTTTGIILSATSTHVTYAQTVAALRAYIDGYAGAQRVNAPALIAIGTNNDIDVRAATGAIWARQVVNPLRAYAAKYPRIAIAGANDIEPGFIGTMAASSAWVSGYLASTSAQFVFNGSADGCGRTATRTRCNNGWTASGVGWMSGAVAPTRVLSLPQIYNSTMPKQWKYISLTNIAFSRAKVNFAGPLTEWTACVTQRGGCSSLTNNVAWTVLWAQLQSDVRIRQASLPYGTDLRIN